MQTKSDKPISDKELIFPEISNHKMIVCGIQGSGKTQFSQLLIDHKQYRVFVYTPNPQEFEECGDNYLIADAKQWSIEQFAETAIHLGKTGVIDGVFLPEFDFSLSHNFEMKGAINDLMISHRHYMLFVIGNTRRPQDIPAKVFESSLFIVCFSMAGSNAAKKLNDVWAGLGDAVQDLPYKSYNAYVKKIGELPFLADYSILGAPASKE